MKKLKVLIPVLICLLALMGTQASAVSYGCTMQNISDDFLYFGAKSYFYSGEDDFEVLDLSSSSAFMIDFFTENYHTVESDVSQITIYLYYANENDVTSGDKVDITLQHFPNDKWVEWDTQMLTFQALPDETDIQHVSFDFDGLCVNFGVDLTDGESFRIVIEEAVNGDWWFYNYFNTIETVADVPDIPEDDDTTDEPEDDDTTETPDSGNGDNGDDGTTDTTPIDDTPEDTTDVTEDDGLPESFLNRLIRLIRELLNLDSDTTWW